MVLSERSGLQIARHKSTVPTPPSSQKELCIWVYRILDQHVRGVDVLEMKQMYEDEFLVELDPTTFGKSVSASFGEVVSSVCTLQLHVSSVVAVGCGHLLIWRVQNGRISDIDSSFITQFEPAEAYLLAIPPKRMAETLSSQTAVVATVSVIPLRWWW